MLDRIRQIVNKKVQKKEMDEHDARLLAALEQWKAERAVAGLEESGIKANLRRYDGYPYSLGATEDPESAPSDS